MSNEISLKRLSGAIGAEVAGIDLNRADLDAVFPAIHRAFLDHAVLVVRDQPLSPDALVTFSRRFGEIEDHVLTQYAHPETPEVLLISNVKEAGKPKGAIRAGQYWHSDLSYMARPTMASMLNAIEIPSYGGDTLFASTTAAYDELSDPMRALLEGLTAVHDYAYAYETFFANVPERVLTAEQKAKVPPVVHPVVRRHPETGAGSLFVSPGFTRRIEELSETESRALLDFLFAHITQPHLIYRHRWSVGDLVIWDNRATWHLAVADYDMAEHRHMHRTSIRGDEPVGLRDVKRRDAA